MYRKYLYLGAFVFVLGIIGIARANEPFSIMPIQDVSVCNDTQLGPDAAERGTGMHMRNVSSRRRVGLIVYDISELGGQPVANVTFSNYGHDGGTVAVYGIIEELDNDIDETTVTWNTAPGVMNDPTPPLDDPVVLDFADLTENILMIFDCPPRGERVSTEPNQLLDDFINSDTDGIVAFLWAPYEEGDSGIVRTKELDVGGSYLEGVYIPPFNAILPNPADGAVDVPRDTDLSWRPGSKAVMHDVYFGADAGDVNEAGLSDPRGVLASSDQAGLSYDIPGELELGQTYYWRIDEVNDAEAGSPWKGKLWSFTVANFLIVEDFEDYNDFPPNEIWNTWIDGYGVATNGSTAGYPDPDFNAGGHYMETDIVHGGEQSMPLFYDNAAGLSEATRTLGSQDWTAEGVVTLTLFYYGDAANAAEPIYVALNGSAVAVNDDTTAALATEWTQWDIPLQVFADQGVNLVNVNSLTLGFGNKTSPQAGGGSGHVFFDDIRLYRPE